MSNPDGNTLQKAKIFIYENARLLDRLRFAHFWEKGSKKAVLTALKAYQNDDGGYGNALEPDIRSPLSQPIPTEMALLTMDEIDRYDPGIVGSIGKYLKQIALPDGGFPRAHLSIKDSPHAPWWTTDREDVFSVNPTGRILGLLIKQKAWMGYGNEPWFRLSIRNMWEHFESSLPESYHDAVQWITFLLHFPDRALARPYWNKLDEWLSQPGVIERNPDAEGYVHKILDWAPTRDSYALRFVKKEEVDLHLTYLECQQQEDGGWPISWPALSPAVEREWRGHTTVNRLLTLKSYGRI